MLDTPVFARIAPNELQERNAAFVILYSDDFEQNKNNKKVLMSFRWNNQFGFIGGLMDDNELPLDSIIREVKEEIGFTMSLEHKQNCEFLCSHFYEEKKLGIHVYTCKITVSEMKNILGSWFLGSDAAYEVAGICAVNTLLSERLLENRFAASGKEELKLFLTKFCY